MFLKTFGIMPSSVQLFIQQEKMAQNNYLSLVSLYDRENILVPKSQDKNNRRRVSTILDKFSVRDRSKHTHQNTSLPGPYFFCFTSEK